MRMTGSDWRCSRNALICKALVVFPEQGKPEMVTSAMSCASNYGLLQSCVVDLAIIMGTISE